MTPDKIRIGSRGSDLALAQAYYIKDRIESLTNSPQTELIIIKTTGDQIQDIPLSQVDMGSNPNERKGFFTKEIEDALLENKIDIAVHSFKDLPTQMPEGLVIGSMPQRLNPLDVIVFPKKSKTKDSPPYIKEGSRIGTSSVRRISQIEFMWPGYSIHPLRGNVPTRLKKLLKGEEFEAILLSGAGVERLTATGFFENFEEDLSSLEFISLSPEEYVPAPAQGALAIQCRDGDDLTLNLIRRMEDKETSKKVSAERTVLAHLNGGCHLPLGSHCIENEKDFSLHVFLGKEAIDNRWKRSKVFSRNGKNPEELARHVIDEIIKSPHVVLTGRPERTEELKAKFGNNISGINLIETRPLNPEINPVKIFLKEASEKSLNTVIAVFSVPGAEYFYELCEKNGISLTKEHKIAFAFTGEKTGQALKRLFPDIPVMFESPDGTGFLLAELLNQNKNSIDTNVFAVCAKEPRPEFYEQCRKFGLNAEAFPVYETISRIPDESELQKLPEKARIVFASPSAANSFFAAFTREVQKKKNFLFCVLGPTTEKSVINSGYNIYAKSVSPDLDVLLGDLL